MKMTRRAMIGRLLRDSREGLIKLAQSADADGILRVGERQDGGSKTCGQAAERLFERGREVGGPDKVF